MPCAGARLAPEPASQLLHQGVANVQLVLHLFHAAQVRGRSAYRVPYLPVIPTFFVRFVMLAVMCGLTSGLLVIQVEKRASCEARCEDEFLAPWRLLTQAETSVPSIAPRTRSQASQNYNQVQSGTFVCIKHEVTCRLRRCTIDSRACPVLFDVADAISSANFHVSHTCIRRPKQTGIYMIASSSCANGGVSQLSTFSDQPRYM